MSERSTCRLPRSKTFSAAGRPGPTPRLAPAPRDPVLRGGWGGGPEAPAVVLAFEGAHLGGCAGAAGGRGLARGLVRLPLIAGEVRVGRGPAPGGGPKGPGLETH